ncbi:MAG: hypothetical protein IKU26_06710 [Clostridia bacterium]|nr:hypothetical protein [Clostridia bacterium]
MSKKLIRTVVCLFVCMALCAGLVACGNVTNPSSPTAGSGAPVATVKPEDLVTGKMDLHFDSLGNFKVVIFSDLRVSKNVDAKVIENIETILNRENPSLVLLGGDLHDGSISNEQELRTVLDQLNAPMEERKIPWCHTFGVLTEGTKTVKSGFGREEQMRIYQSYPYCISGSDTADTYGVSNYVLPVYIPDQDSDKKNDKIGFNVWCLDANSYLNDYVAGFEDQVVLKRKLSGGSDLDCLHYSQLLWYWDTSVALENYNGKQIPGMMYFQVPIYQFQLLIRNQQQTGVQGTLNSGTRKVTASERESGALWACYERGDVKHIFCGYNEKNDFSGKYLGITMAFCSTVGTSAVQETAGARVVAISQNGAAVTTSMSYLK